MSADEGVEVPYLEDWITPGLAAKKLGMTKQSVHNLMLNGRFPSLRRIAADGSRPYYVLSAREIEVFGLERTERLEKKKVAKSTENNS